MSQDSCEVCGSEEDLTYAIVTSSPIDPEDARTEDVHPFCSDHAKELAEKSVFFVRELPPNPEEWGGFTRNRDEDGDILYDPDISKSAWIKFDPQDEIELHGLDKEDE